MEMKSMSVSDLGDGRGRDEVARSQGITFPH